MDHMDLHPEVSPEVEEICVLRDQLAEHARELHEAWAREAMLREALAPLADPGQCGTWPSKYWFDKSQTAEVWCQFENAWIPSSPDTVHGDGCPVLRARAAIAEAHDAAPLEAIHVAVRLLHDEFRPCGPWALPEEIGAAIDRLRCLFGEPPENSSSTEGGA